MHLHPHLSSVAFTNRLRSRHPMEKVLFGAGLLVVTMVVPPLPWAFVILLITSLAAIAGARISVASWATILFVPFSFALLTAVGLTIQFDSGAPGIPIVFVPAGLPIALRLLVRSTAAISCLSFIGWTTPIMELLPPLERAGFPKAFTDLALLIYRFAFVATTTVQEMRRAQSWRMGRADYRTRLHAASILASSLLIRCIDRTTRLERGLAARGYAGALHVLPPRQGPSPLVLLATGALQATILVVALLPGGSW